MMAPASVLWICAFVVAGVFAVMIHSIATFRRSGDARPSAIREIFWAIVPIFIMVSTALPAVRLAVEHVTHNNIVAVQAHNDP